MSNYHRHRIIRHMARQLFPNEHTMTWRLGGLGRWMNFPPCWWYWCIRYCTLAYTEPPHLNDHLDKP